MNAHGLQGGNLDRRKLLRLIPRQEQVRVPSLSTLL